MTVRIVVEKYAETQPPAENSGGFRVKWMVDLPSHQCEKLNLLRNISLHQRKLNIKMPRTVLFGYREILATMLLILMSTIGANAQSEFISGVTFSQNAPFNYDKNGCDAYVTRVKKSWSSTGGVIESVENWARNKVTHQSSKSNGLIEYDVPRIKFGPKETIKTSLTFNTIEGKSGTVTTKMEIFFETSQCGNQVYRVVKSTNVLSSDSKCLKIEFDSKFGTPRERRTVEWIYDGSDSGLTLTCGGSDLKFSPKSVSSSSSAVVTVPIGAVSGAKIACTLRKSGRALCAAQLDIR